ncbi:MacS family sensor histidine kinase [Nocardioides currus]|uniref:MacS family sensor histidine kinase n=1 Tax=Nocardioides currus TaxID=2133958 RepID=UPI001FAF2199
MRVVVTVNVIVLNLYRRDNYDHPWAGIAVVAALVAWTGWAIRASTSAQRRTPLFMALDLAVAVAAIAVTPVIKGADFNATIPGFWVMGALLAWAVHWHWRGGLVAAAVLSVTDLVLRDGIDQANYGNVFLLMIGGPIVGYMCESLQRMAAERDSAQRVAAAAEERTRLARAVHDGVLQVLALVQRRGAASGDPEIADLARLAGEQERVLRSLIRQQGTVTTAPAERDLAGLLEDLGTRHALRVDVATPGVPVPLPSEVAGELAAAVGSCLDNVAAHVGPDARAWVLLEVLPDQVVVSVRDDGPGIPEGRLESALEEGRLGVSESIRGRLGDLGGTATLDTGAHGTEWELAVPTTGPTTGPRP